MVSYGNKCSYESRMKHSYIINYIKGFSALWNCLIHCFMPYAKGPLNVQYISIFSRTHGSIWFLIFSLKESTNFVSGFVSSPLWFHIKGMQTSFLLPMFSVLASLKKNIQGFGRDYFLWILPRTGGKHTSSLLIVSLSTTINNIPWHVMSVLQVDSGHMCTK